MSRTTSRRRTSESRKNQRRAHLVLVPVNPMSSFNSGEGDRSAVRNALGARPVLVVALAVITLVVIFDLSSSGAPKDSLAPRSDPGTWTIILASALCESHAIAPLPHYATGAVTPPIEVWPEYVQLTPPQIVWDSMSFQTFGKLAPCMFQN